jgi:hypothetical protein
MLGVGQRHEDDASFEGPEGASVDACDLLRNEKPVYLIWEPEGVNNSRISTLAEVVGEGELEKS